MISAKNRWLLALLVPASLAASIATYESSGKHVGKPYRDVGGVWTVCDGYAGKDVNPNKYYSVAECKAITDKAIAEHGKGVLNCVKVELSQKEYEAYTSLAYNIGVPRFCGSNIVRTLNAGNRKMACQGIYVHTNGKPAWSNVGGKYVQGLQNRRVKEYNTCMQGVYSWSGK